ncbi:MAG: flagellar biosynthesis protein FlhB [Candidatus Margulisiibacteriota bacterium]
MGEDSGDKTEEPTPHKIREARKKGQIAKSQEFTSAIMILVSFYTFKAVGPMMLDRISGHTTMVLSLLDMEFSSAMVGMLLTEALKTILLTLAPLLAMVFVMVILIESLQTGFLFSLSALSPKFENLNPINGFKKFFALKQYIELIKSIIKMTAVGTILFYTIQDLYPLVSQSQQQSPMSLIALVGKIIIDTISKVGAVYFALAILDYFYQKYEYIKSLKMSKKEIKEEYKRLEGDPIIKQRQREAQRAMSQGRQMGQVPGADVVVTNPTHIAVAIKYDPEKKDAIPLVVAKGQRLIAEQIKQIADEHDIPIIENPPVARMLFKLVEIGHYVPKESFKVVAEILAFVFHLKNKKTKATNAFDR